MVEMDGGQYGMTNMVREFVPKNWSCCKEAFITDYIYSTNMWYNNY
jgi:hypothetical protein